MEWRGGDDNCTKVRNECIITCTFIISIIVIIVIAKAFAYTLSTSQAYQQRRNQEK
jgi:hypothetical protein